MRHLLCLTLLAGLAIPSTRADEQAAKTVEVKHRDLTLQIPEDWKTQPNSSNLRLATYHIPAVKDDKEPAELTIYNFGGGGGGVADNISRWVAQFASEGRESKVTQGMAGENEYYYADISGTYNKPVGPPILRKTAPAPGYRMHAVILVIKDKGVYYLKMAGPDATVAAQADVMRKAFGADAASEKPYEL
jgi:gluconolactonase